MEPDISSRTTDAETVASSTPLHNNHIPYKNGLTGYMVSQSHESTANASDNPISKRVESVIKSLEKESQQTERDRKYGLHGNASQLLKAAASQVTNNVKHAVDYINTYGSESNSTADKILHNSPYDFIPPAFTSIAQSSSIPMCSYNPTITTVSFSSKPSMSTGFSSFSSGTSQPVPITSLGPHSSSVIRYAGPKPTPEKHVIVPFLWRRTCDEFIVHYYSPSGVKLSSLAEVKKYLLADDTCKCGLPCPFHVEKVFNFDSSYASRECKLTDFDLIAERTTSVCCHRKHIKSHALLMECQSNAAKITKVSPVKRRAKTITKRASMKSPGSVKSYNSTAAHEYDNSSMGGTATVSSTSLTDTKQQIISPLPPVEVVVSQLRQARSQDQHHSSSTIPTQPFSSPNQLPSGISPKLLSPGHGYMDGASSLYSMHPSQHIPGQMSPVSTPGFPINPMVHYTVHRGQTEQGMLIPGYQPGAYPPNLPLPHPAAFPPMPPYHTQPSGYYQDFSGSSALHSRPPYWSAHPSHMMPPPPAVASQGYPPHMWPGRPAESGLSPANQNRKRRASSKSSNGGQSDTGYQSGLGSPGLNNPSQAGPSRREDPRNENPVTASGDAAGAAAATTSSSVIKLAEENPTDKETSMTSNDKKQHSTALNTETNKASHTLTGGSERQLPTGVSKPSEPASSKSVHVTTMAQPLHNNQTHILTRMPMRPMNPYMMPNGVPVPVGAYMDPMYMPSQHPAYRQPMMYHPPGYPLHPHSQPPAGYPPAAHLYQQVPAGGGRTVQPEASAKSDTAPKTHLTGNTKPDEPSDLRKDVTNEEKTDTMRQQKLPDISTITLPRTSSVIVPPPPQSPVHNGVKHPNSSSSSSNITLPPTSSISSEMMRGPPAAPPVHMLTSPNGPMFYRYYEPRFQSNPSAMYYPLQGPPLYQPTQQPHISIPGSHIPGYPYPHPSLSPVTSPKRKRRKAVNKTSIESHSALLAAGSSNTSLEGDRGRPAVNGTLTDSKVHESATDLSTSSSSSMQTKSL